MHSARAQDSGHATTPTYRERKSMQLSSNVDLEQGGSRMGITDRSAPAQSHTSPTQRGEKEPLVHSDSRLGSSSSDRLASHAAASPSTWSSALASEAIYCLTSAGTILFNKHALSSFQFPAPNTLLFFQFSMAVFMLKSLHLLGFIHLEPLRWESVKLWMPVNLIFVAMNVTGFFALQTISAGMFTVLKNLSNIMTIIGDQIIYGNRYSWQVWLCLMLMIGSAMLGGWTDLTFSAVGYTWQLVNCVFTAAYSLYLCGVIKRASEQQHDKQQLKELSMVYYNNLLSVPPLALLSLAFGEPAKLRHYQGIHSLEFQVVAVLGGLMGFGVSFASIWCMSRTSPTIYSLTGSLNKVVVALVGMWYFQEPTDVYNVFSIASGLAAGVLFVFAKATNRPSTPASSSGGSSSGTSSPSSARRQDQQAAGQPGGSKPG